MSKPYFVGGLHNVLFAAGIGGLLICACVIFRQWFLECDIQISAIDLVCQYPLNNRCGYEYLGVDKKGVFSKVDLAYTFRRDELAMGDLVKKEKFSFTSQLNGRGVVWEFEVQYLAGLVLSLLVLGLWRILTLKLSHMARLPAQTEH